MASSGYIVRCASAGGWEAVRVHCDGYPTGLGAKLLRHASGHGGNPAEVLAVAFGTNGWTSWPHHPHHPMDPEDNLFGASNLWESSWSYWFRPSDDGWVMEVRDGIGAHELAQPPRWRFVLSRANGDELGAMGIRQPLRPPRAMFERAPGPEAAAALETLLSAWQLTSEPRVGVGAWPSQTARHLHLPSRVLDLLPPGELGTHFYTPRRTVTMPDADFFAHRPQLLAQVLSGLGLADPQIAVEGKWLQLFDAVFAAASPTLQPYPLDLECRPTGIEERMARLAITDLPSFEDHLSKVARSLCPGWPVEVCVSAETDEIEVLTARRVVDVVDNHHRQIAVAEARAHGGSFAVGDLFWEVDPDLLAEVLQLL